MTHEKEQPQNLHILYVIIYNYVLYTCRVPINAEMSAWAMYKKFNNIITQFTNPFLESGFNMVELTFQHQHWPVSGTIQHARMKMHYNKVPPSPTPLKCA